ncbi:MAG: response regulator [Verrucomicrobiales bacterium]
MSKKVLLVDDEAGFTELLKINLEKTGEFEVQIENDSTLALGTARRFQPDAILLDVVMPGMDGGDVQTQLQGDPFLSSVPIIMLTALVDSAELSEGAVAQSGSSIMLPKPVDLALLLNVLHRAINDAEQA